MSYPIAPDQGGDLDETVLAVADVARSLLETPGTTFGEALADVRSLLAADRLVVLSVGLDGVEVHVETGFRASTDPEICDAVLALHEQDRLFGGDLEPILDHMGISGGSVSLAGAGSPARPDVLVGAWADPDDRTVSDRDLLLIAGYLSALRVALDRRRETIDNHLRRERTQWAHEIHDGATQSLTAAVLHLESLRARLLSDGSDDLASEIEHAQDGIKTSLAELRKLISDLSADAAPGVGASDAMPLRAYVDDIVARWRLPARVSFDQDSDAPLPPSLVDVAHIVIREALANAAKHSRARQVTVRVARAGDQIQIEVADNGRGFAPETVRAGGTGHFGLRLVRRRVEERRGTFEIRSRPGAGTTVLARFPMS